MFARKNILADIAIVYMNSKNCTVRCRETATDVTTGVLLNDTRRHW
jgi:hypothetical protein